MIHDSILGTIGNTPIVRINQIAPAHVTMYVKCEAFNPLSSVKDRLAFGIIEDAEQRGVLKPGQNGGRGDASGNTGIALAMVCRCRERTSLRRRDVRFLLDRAPEGDAHPGCQGDPHPRGGARQRHGQESGRAGGKAWLVSVATVRESGESSLSPEHDRARDPARLCGEKRLDVFVITGYGTGGTLTGAGEMLKLARPDIRIVVTEPEGAALLSGREWAPHKIQGWTPDFVGAVLNRSVFDEIVTVTDVEARDAARELASKEGIFCGISSGGTFAAARKVAEKSPKGTVLLAMLPDTGERYLSTILFEGINEGNDEL